MISTGLLFDGWRRARRTRRRRAGFSRSRRSATGGPAPTRRGSAGSGCRRSATRCPAAFACKRERGVLRFNARGPAGLIDGKAPGNASKLDDAQRKALADIVERGPIPAIHEVVRWRLADLAQWIWEEFGISLSETTVGRELRALGYRKISARPRHFAQNGLAIDDFKKPSRAAARLCAVETACAIFDDGRAVADCLLEGLTPLKNVAHGLMRT